MRLENTRIEFTEDNNFLTVILPVTRKPLLMVFYSLLLLIWILMLGVTVYFLFRPQLPATVQLSFGYLFTWYLIVVIWLVIWVRYVGRSVWRGWLYQMSLREVLLISADLLTIVRPAVIGGLHDGYDMRYVTPFYVHEKHNCPAFQYGKVQRHLFAQSLDGHETSVLVSFLNRRFFPFVDNDDDEWDDVSA